MREAGDVKQSQERMGRVVFEGEEGQRARQIVLARGDKKSNRKHF